MLTKLHTLVKIKDEKFDTLAAACEDGSVYTYSWSDQAWSALPPIPGTTAAERRK